jgi:hypothetical protein
MPPISNATIPIPPASIPPPPIPTASIPPTPIPPAFIPPIPAPFGTTTPPIPITCGLTTGIDVGASVTTTGRVIVTNDGRVVGKSGNEVGDIVGSEGLLEVAKKVGDVVGSEGLLEVAPSDGGIVDNEGLLVVAEKVGDIVGSGELIKVKEDDGPIDGNEGLLVVAEMLGVPENDGGNDEGLLEVVARIGGIVGVGEVLGSCATTTTAMYEIKAYRRSVLNLLTGDKCIVMVSKEKCFWMNQCGFYIVVCAFCVMKVQICDMCVLQNQIYGTGLGLGPIFSPKFY